MANLEVTGLPDEMLTLDKNGQTLKVLMKSSVSKAAKLVMILANLHLV
jgi:hypothetical protein